MIYIIKFSKPLGNPENPRGQAKYYLGYCEDHRLNERLDEHKVGLGSSITRWAVNHGISLNLVAVLDGDRTEERRLKNQKNTPRIVKKYMERNNGNINLCS